MKLWLSRNWFWYGREWPYKNVKPRIICEKYLRDNSDVGLKDYKIFCFNGRSKLVMVDFNKFQNHQRNLYDLKWNCINASIKYPKNPKLKISKPKLFDEMLDIANKLSIGMPHVRVDLYCVSVCIYFGELTFYNGAGYEKIEPKSLNNRMSEWIDLKYQI